MSNNKGNDPKSNSNHLVLNFSMYLLFYTRFVASYVNMRNTTRFSIFHIENEWDHYNNNENDYSMKTIRGFPIFYFLCVCNRMHSIYDRVLWLS